MILRHRDRELLRFEWAGARGVRVLSVNDAERKFLPIEMVGTASDEALWKWLTHRTVPRGRKYILSALRQLGIPSDDVRAIVEFSRGLSLNDVYWMLHVPSVGITSKNPKTENDEKHCETDLNVDKGDVSVSIKSTNYDSLEYQILENMRADKAITAAEIADILQVEQRTIERKIKFLREQGKLVRMGPRKTGYWQVKD